MEEKKEEEKKSKKSSFLKTAGFVVVIGSLCFIAGANRKKLESGIKSLIKQRTNVEPQPQQQQSPRFSQGDKRVDGDEYRHNNSERNAGCYRPQR